MVIDAAPSEFIPADQPGNTARRSRVWIDGGPLGRGRRGGIMADFIEDEGGTDGINRRGFLRCMAWAGTGLAWVSRGGVLRSAPLPIVGQTPGRALGAGDFVFAQISDSHIGFSKDANKDVVSTLQAAIARVNALPVAPDFLVHTGDLTHLSKPEEFDTLEQVLKSARTSQVFFVPGEHDILDGDGSTYLARHGAGTKGHGWFSFDHKGVHVIGLVNVVDLKAGGLGNLGQDQLEWLKRDVADRSSSTPIVVLAHIPLWSVYPEWGWGTDDGAQALGYLKKFGSVSVLNGHIHQTLQKIEGNVTFHTAASTAFPQPAPGTAPSPGPMTVPAERLRSLLGLSGVSFVRTSHTLAVVNETLDAAAASITIDNFKFSTAELTVAPGTRVTWTNRDDAPHRIVATDKAFASGALDTGDAFSVVFDRSGVYEYFCSIHPHMTGRIVVK
jgi:plastocyanin